MGADLLNKSAASYIPAATMKGRIAIPDNDPKAWRSRGRREWKPMQAVLTIIAIIEGVKSPQEIKRDRRIRRLRELME